MSFQQHKIFSARNVNEESKQSLQLEEKPIQVTFDCKNQDSINGVSDFGSQQDAQENQSEPHKTPGSLVNVAINAFKDFNRNQSEVELKSNKSKPETKQSLSKVNSSVSNHER